MAPITGFTINDVQKYGTATDEAGFLSTFFNVNCDVNYTTAAGKSLTLPSFSFLIEMDDCSLAEDRADFDINGGEGNDAIRLEAANSIANETLLALVGADIDAMETLKGMCRIFQLMGGKTV